jgi:flagellar hook-associated protein 3 FlgL
MRVTDSLMTRNFLGSVSDLYEKLENANKQISTGKRINQLEDSPAGSSEVVRLKARLEEVDQYKANVDTTEMFAGTADSALGTAFDLVTSIFTRGSQAASNLYDDAVPETVASDIRALRDQLLSAANASVGGRYLFGGSEVVDAPFELTGDTVAFQGDTSVNNVKVGDGMQIAQGVDGEAALLGAFTAIQNLVTALDNRDLAGVRSSLESVSAELKNISAGRSELGVSLAALERTKSDLDTTELNLKERRGRVEDANLAAVITDLSQTQTSLRAVLSARSGMVDKNLFDYLG